MRVIREVVTVFPLWDRVLVLPDEKEDMTKAGIIIPETAQEEASRGTIVQVGPGKKGEPMVLKLGDRIAFSKYSGSELTIMGITYKVMWQTDIQAMLVDDYAYIFKTAEQQKEEFVQEKQEEHGVDIGLHTIAIKNPNGSWSIKSNGKPYPGLYADLNACIRGWKIGLDNLELVIKAYQGRVLTDDMITLKSRKIDAVKPAVDNDMVVKEETADNYPEVNTNEWGGKDKGLTTDPEDPRLGRGVDKEPVAQHDVYLVLSEEEKAKGYVRPVRQDYVHVGAVGPTYPLVDLTEAEKVLYGDYKYVKYERYPEGERNTPVTGRYWTQEQLDAVNGCGVRTSMAKSIAETYARNPKFYGATYCMGCKKHLPVDEFVWDGTEERVGS